MKEACGPVLVGVVRLLGCPFDGAWCLVCELCLLAVICVSCRRSLCFVFLGGARCVVLSPCNMHTRSPWASAKDITNPCARGEIFSARRERRTESLHQCGSEVPVLAPPWMRCSHRIVEQTALPVPGLQAQQVRQGSCVGEEVEK